MSPIILMIYLFACGVCGFMGRRTALGFVGHFLLAVFITPVADYVVLAVGRSRQPAVGRGSFDGRR